MSGPTHRYFDEGDEGELVELLALLLSYREIAVRDEAYAAASALGEWIDCLRDRLLELQVLARARASSVRSR